MVDQAILYTRQNNYSEAIRLFEQINATSPLNDRAKYYFAKALHEMYKANKDSSLLLKAYRKSKELYDTSPNFEANTNLFYWLTYKQFVANQEMRMDWKIGAAQFIVQHARQQLLSPYEMTIFKMVEELINQESPDWQSILQFLDQLNPLLLNREEREIEVEGKKISFASNVEKFYKYRYRAYFELKQFEKSIQEIDRMTQQMERLHLHFHNDHDIWSQRKKAHCWMQLGNLDTAKDILIELTIKKPHSAIFKDLMDICLLQDDRKTALGYAAEGLLDKAGKHEHKLKILLAFAEMLEEEGKLKESFSHYHFIQKIRERNGWSKDKTVEERLAAISAKQQVQPLSNQAIKNLWLDYCMNQYEEGNGVIDKILPNQKSGFIKDHLGISIYFNIRNSNCSMEQLPIGTAVQFKKKPSFDKSKNRKSTEAIQITLCKGVIT